MNKPLIIRASAGTGKTYRLSLEFINLLLQRRVNFDEILVITFTKKATAEIRNRIFEQLAILISDSEASRELRKNFSRDVNTSIKFDRSDIELLQKAYQSMITSKSEVKISTIDSFVNNIFTGIIAPFKNIQDFKIDNTINQDILPEIYEYILQSDKFEIYSDIFTKKRNRNLQRFDQLILDIIEKRWLFNSINLRDFDTSLIETNSIKNYQKYTQLRIELLKMLRQEMEKKNLIISDILKKDIKHALSRFFQLDLNASELSFEQFKEALLNKDFISDNNKILLGASIYNGNKIRAKELKQLSEETRSSLAEYLYWSEAYQEQYSLIVLAAEVYRIYDEIKLRDKIFTHNDISYYTLMYLYDPELSVIDRTSVMNVFYEQLSYKIRYLLIDEFQDTSILQWQIFKPILQELFSGSGQKEYGGAIIVGDEKQAIYGWRGGERKLLRNFPELMQLEIEHDDLKTSFRSRPVIIHNLNRLFDHKKLNFTEDWRHEDIDCDKKAGGYLKIGINNTHTQEDLSETFSRSQFFKEFVQKELKPLLEKETINPGDTAIIMRKNTELNEMAAALQEADISFSLETSGSLFQHRAIKPLLHILNFLIYEDLLELIKFWRSDLILMYPVEIDKLLKKSNLYNDLNEFLYEEKDQPGFQLFYRLRTGTFSVLQTIKLLLDEFPFTRIFATENDLKNIFRLLEIAAQFQATEHEQQNDLNGFLNYCRKIEAKDEFSSLGQKVNDCLTLLTIHKSKGLQFETVFAFFDVTARMGNSGSGLKFYYRFNHQFDLLKDMAISFNYDHVLKLSAKNSLIEYISRKESDDELNNIYVALTRAKNNLFINLYFFKKGEKGDLNSLLNSVDESSPLIRKFTRHLFQEYSSELQEISPDKYFFEIGELSSEIEEEKIKPRPAEIAVDLFRLPSQPQFAEVPESELQKLKTEILENMSIQIGNLVHYYLSQIEFDSPGARKSAFKRTLAKYGNLFTRV